MAATPKAEKAFDPEVVQELRRQFASLDHDSSGEIDAREACRLSAQLSSPDASEAEIKRTAENLMRQADIDRSGKMSFDEYCFRFGRREQMEAARRRRAGTSSFSASTSAAAGDSGSDPHRAESERVRREREELDRERERLRREREELEAERARTRASGTNDSPPPHYQIGARVMIRNLISAPELNGKFAKVLRFDTSAGRYVVELDDGMQKSLKPNNLESAASSTGGHASPAGNESIGQKAAALCRKVAAHIQVWLAQYEWWQLMLGAGVLIVFIMAYFELSGRYGTDQTSTQRSHRSTGSTYRAREQDQDSSSAYDSTRAYDEYDDSYEDAHRPRRSQHHRYEYAQRGGDRGNGGLFGFLGISGQTQSMLVLGVLGYLCWKGIIPVHKMSFFQLYMLWNIVEPLLFGGGRRRGHGMGMGGFARGFGRRGMFF